MHKMLAIRGIAVKYALVSLHLEYCPTVWNPDTNHCQKRLRVQNHTMKAILNKPLLTQSSTLRDQLQWKTLAERRKLHYAKLTYTFTKTAPPYLWHNNMLTRNKDTGRQSGRNIDRLFVPHPTSNCLKYSFSL